MKCCFVILIVLLHIGVSSQTRLYPPVVHTVEVIETSACPNCVRLEWDSIPGAEFYEILKYDPGNQIGLPEPYPENNPNVVTNFFVDVNSYALSRSEMYHVVARDTSNSNINDSEWSDTAITLYLKPLIYDSCNMEVKLNWVGSGNGSWYNIYRSANGGSFEVIDSTKSDSYFDTALESNMQYTYMIVIRSVFTSNSNKRNVNISDLLVPDKSKQKIFLVSPDGDQTKFQVSVDSLIQIESYDLFSSSSVSGTYSNQESVKYSGNDEISFTASNSSPRYYYRMQTKNICGVYVDTTNTVRPIELKIVQDGNDITLNWHSGFIDNAGEEYYLITYIDGEMQPLQQIEGSTILLDLGEMGGEYSESFVFQIRNIDSKGNVVISNTVVALKLPFLKMPNAFTPNGDGVNDEIGPFQKYIENANAQEFRSFSFIVYDKYGGVVYESDNPDEAWNGKKSGTDLSEGPYVTYIKFVTVNGRTVEENGMIEIVYP